MILLDTNILIKIWRGDARLENHIQALDCAVDTIVRLEFLQGTNKRSFNDAKNLIDRFEFVPFSVSVSHTAIHLIESYAHLKGLRLADAIIAATCLENDLLLLTLNAKHFTFIPDLVLI